MKYYVCMARAHRAGERKIFIDNLLVRMHSVIDMIGEEAPTPPIVRYYTPHRTAHHLSPEPSTFNSQPSNLNVQRSALKPQPLRITTHNTTPHSSKHRTCQAPTRPHTSENMPSHSTSPTSHDATQNPRAHQMSSRRVFMINAQFVHLCAIFVPEAVVHRLI